MCNVIIQLLKSFTEYMIIYGIHDYIRFDKLNWHLRRALERRKKVNHFFLWHAYVHHKRTHLLRHAYVHCKRRYLFKAAHESHKRSVNDFYLVLLRQEYVRCKRRYLFKVAHESRKRSVNDFHFVLLRQHLYIVEEGEYFRYCL